MGLLSTLRRRLTKSGGGRPAFQLSREEVGRLLSAAEQEFLAGRWAATKALCNLALTLDPASAGAQYLIGLVCFQEGDASGALALFQRAAALGLRSVQLDTNLGIAYLQTGRLDEAERVLVRVLAQDSKVPAALCAIGVVHVRKGDLASAIAAFEEALLIEPQSIEALNNLGGALRELGKLDEALDRYQYALSVSPNNPALWLNIGIVQLSSRRWGAAVSSFQSAIKLDDRNPLAWRCLGDALSELGEHSAAQLACDNALRLRPDWPEAHGSSARVHWDLGDRERAEAEVRRGLDLCPGWVAGWLQLGAMRCTQSDFANAEAHLRHAVSLSPQHPAARFELAHFLLGQGRYAEGFALFESRFAAVPGWFSNELRTVGLDDGPRRWNGGPLHGKHILVIGEQGFGDQLMMFRYLPLLKLRGATGVSLKCAQELRRLAERIPGVDSILSVGEGLSEADIVVPAMSLPYCFGSTTESIPNAQWLEAQDIERDRWQDRLPCDCMRVGIVWSGKSTREDLARRGLTLETLAPLLDVEGVTFVSLQKHEQEETWAPPSWTRRVVDVMGSCEDFLDTASLIANLDLVISVDTAVVHLSGTLGTPTWLVLKEGGEWRWGPTLDSTPWYPSIRIFRQHTGEGWSDVVATVRSELIQTINGVSKARKQRRPDGTTCS